MASVRIIGAGLLLAAGFAAGIAWNSRAAPSDTTQAPPRPVTPRGDLTSSEQSLTDLFEAVSPSVVYVTSLTVRRDLFRLNVMEIPQGTGSGFVWDTSGHVVTNFHVISGGERFEVTLADRSPWSATLVGYAPEKDLAVLKLDAPRDRLKPIVVGTSHDLRVGQTTLAIGNPFGFDQTLTTGIVSALGREIESIARVPISDVIQTDAAINPGNSGGPLLDSSGRLIGVNTAIYSPSGGYAGIGFAIPVDTVNWVVPDLIAFGRIRRPTIGVELAPPNINQQLNGVLVMSVVEGSGAHEAGVRPTRRDRQGRVVLGDIIVAIDGEPVRSRDELRLRLEQRQVNDVVSVTVDRDGDQKELKVRLGEPN